MIFWKKVDNEEKSENKKGFFAQLKDGLSKTHDNLIARLDRVILGKKEIDKETYDHLEEVLITSDLGAKTSIELIQSIQEKMKRTELSDSAIVLQYLKEEIISILKKVEKSLDVNFFKPYIIMIVGVNGSGKTTTIGKMAGKFKKQQKRVLLAAGDTFRAAAIEQLEIWGERVHTDIVKHKMGADPSAVAFDAVKAAVSRDIDVVLIDTAGRLHTKSNLMQELEKLKRVIARELPGAPHEVLLIIDANNGQNAISQARQFNETLGVTGIVLTKLDGTAKGGVVIGIADELKIPIRYIGIGEKEDDLMIFNADDFVSALFS